MAKIRKRKGLMWTEVAKNDQDSLVDRWLRDQIKPDTWDKIAHVFPPRLTIKFDRLIVLSKSSRSGWFLHVSLIVIIKGRSPMEVSLIVIINQV
jgi:hypothetical protein